MQLSSFLEKLEEEAVLAPLLQTKTVLSERPRFVNSPFPFAFLFPSPLAQCLFKYFFFSLLPTHHVFPCWKTTNCHKGGKASHWQHTCTLEIILPQPARLGPSGHLHGHRSEQWLAWTTSLFSKWNFPSEWTELDQNSLIDKFMWNISLGLYAIIFVLVNLACVNRKKGNNAKRNIKTATMKR